MKRLLFILLTVALFGCHNDIWEELNKQNDRITELENLCAKMNDNISALQIIISALENKDFVNSVTPIVQDGVEIGYKIEFSKGVTATIYHGIDGTDGVDGHSPIVGVKQDTDGVFYWTHGLYKQMRENEYGRIINLSSTAVRGNPGQANYSTTKAGMQGFTRTMAKELGRKNVRMNCIAPGYIDTEMMPLSSSAERDCTGSEINNASSAP